MYLGLFGALLEQFLLMYIFANFTTILVGILNVIDSNTREAACNNEQSKSLMIFFEFQELNKKSKCNK